MSNYQGLACNPSSRMVEKAMFLDDYFGRHEYGVRFKDGKVHPIIDVVTLTEHGPGCYTLFYHGRCGSLMAQKSDGGFRGSLLTDLYSSYSGNTMGEACEAFVKVLESSIFKGLLS